MNIRKYIDRIEAIHQLIKMKNTGSPKKLAIRLGISERTLYDCINEMKELGAPIEYSDILQSYTYSEDVHFIAGYRKSEYLTHEHLKKITGGTISFFNYFNTANILQYDDLGLLRNDVCCAQPLHAGQAENRIE